MLNDESTSELIKRLKKESNKFVKACDQIKLVKNRISELLNLFNEQQHGESTNQMKKSEKLRLEIESLQSIKSAFFLYANRKADEITRLQCELYGEEAVRMAYDTAPVSALEPVPSNEQHRVAEDQTTTTTTTTAEHDNLNSSWNNNQNESYYQSIADTFDDIYFNQQNNQAFNHHHHHHHHSTTNNQAEFLTA